jgi:hypothetical protein
MITTAIAALFFAILVVTDNIVNQDKNIDP